MNQVSELLGTAQAILVVLPLDLNSDKVAAGLSLYLSLKKAGKQVSVVCSTSMTVEYSSLVGVDKIASKIKGKNLTVSFDYIEDAIEKVSYNIENNKFNLVIQPKEGLAPISTDKVEYSYSGGQADLVFIIGDTDKKDLGKIYEENKKLFDQVKIVNISEPEAACSSELVAKLLAQLQLPVDADIATNLLKGIEETTKIFSATKAGAGTLEAAVFCLRAGGKKPGQAGKKISLEPMAEEVSAKKPPEEKPQPDWLAPKIYKGNTLI